MLYRWSIVARQTNFSTNARRFEMSRKSKMNRGRACLSVRFLLYLRLALYSVLEAISQGMALGYQGGEDEPLSHPDQSDADKAK